jgi:hypothetical protein
MTEMKCMNMAMNTKTDWGIWDIFRETNSQDLGIKLFETRLSRLVRYHMRIAGRELMNFLRLGGLFSSSDDG